jgi:ankyrin repeat protein
VSLHDKDGTLPLHMAAAACDATVLKKVVAVMARTDRRTMTDVRDQRGQQAMHYAAGEGNLEVMRVLVSKHNASIRAADNEGITPLLVAAMSGQATSIRPLVVELGADPHEADDAGMTALHHAAANGHVECIAALVDLGANVDAELPSGTRLTAGASPLHLAACEGHAACVSELVRRGARVETRDKQGWTALLYADFCRNRQCIVEMLQPNNVEVCATQLSNLGRLLQSDRGETCERVRKVIEYAATVPEFYQAINRHVADNLSALEGHMSFLLSNKALLNFANKHAWFLRRLQPSRDFGGYSWAQVDECRLAVDRQDLAGSALLALQALTPEQLRAPHLRVLWADEEGAGTGPVREFFAAAPAALVDPARGLFVAIDGRAHHPAPAPAGEAAQAVHRANMTAFGRLVPRPARARARRCRGRAAGVGAERGGGRWGWGCGTTTL